MTDIQLLKDIVKKLGEQQREIDVLREHITVLNDAMLQVADCMILTNMNTCQ
jgi:hypothetical protein